MLFKDTKCPNCDAYYDPTLLECPSCHNSNELFKINRLPKRVPFLHPGAQAGLFMAGFAYCGMLFSQFVFTLALYFAPWDEILKQVIVLTLTYLAMFAGLISIVLLTRRELFFKKFNSGVDYIYGVAYAVSIVAVGTILGSIISFFHDAGNNVNQTTAETILTNYPILALFVLGILGPICEELTYRVGLYSLLRRINKYLAFAVTTIVFALIHFDFFASDMISELWSLPTYLALGFLLTLAYEHRGPACSIIAHSVYNLIACLLMLVKLYV